MVEEKTVLKIVNKLKLGINKEISNNNVKLALKLIFNCANILYNTNLYYVDEDLENYLNDVSRKMNLSLSTTQDKDVLIYYDGFGINDRGLVQIYLKALCKLRKVVYVTYSDCKDRIPDVLRIINENGCKAVFIDRCKGNFQKQIIALNKIITEQKPEKFFFYSTPNDVVGTVIMNAYDGILTRYQINLTDHAFWLGARCIDKCIEFRDYGASVSKKYRGISLNKIVKLPFYPEIHSEREFEGFPFEFKDGDKVFFSGGALYKTLGGDNKYYKIVEHILSTHKNTIFWYAGNGNSEELNKIIKKYPGRAYHTMERRDLFQVIKHSRFYLSTYPLCGGLMYQFAASAGRVPVTLRYDEITDGFLIKQSELGIEFEQMDDLYAEVDKLIVDDEYFNTRKNQMHEAVISEENFRKILNSIISDSTEDSLYIKFTNIDTENFRREYLKRIRDIDIDAMIVNKYTIKSNLKHMPIRFLRGVWRKFQRKFL